MAALLSLLSGFGLSTAAGLNPYLPLLVVGIMGRLGWIELSQPFDLLAHPWAFVIIGVLAIGDFFADKVPVIDSGLHVAGMVIAPVAGAILFLAQNGIGEVDPLLAGVAGVVVAGATHSARAAVRPAVTAATAGTANPVLSFVEDLIAVGLAILAILVPVLGVIVAALLLVWAVRFARRTLGVWRRG